MDVELRSLQTRTSTMELSRKWSHLVGPALGLARLTRGCTLARIGRLYHSKPASSPDRSWRCR